MQLKAADTIVWVLRQGEYQQQLAALARQQEEQLLAEQQVRSLSPWDDKPITYGSTNIPLLKAISTAVWKFSRSPEACYRFRQLGIVRLFIRHLNQQTEEVSKLTLVFYE